MAARKAALLVGLATLAALGLAAHPAAAQRKTIVDPIVKTVSELVQTLLIVKLEIPR